VLSGTMETMTDLSDLAVRLSKDVDTVFPEVVQVLSPGLYSGALRMLGHRQDAEDITQDALISAYRALGEYPPDRVAALRLPGWLWTIAANLCRNRLRQRSRKTTLPLDGPEPADGGAGPDERALQSDLGDQLSAHLLTLSWPMRSAVVLRHVVGLTTDEISTALGRPSATVRSDIHRGLERLRHLLEEETA
jgi:RNA polymerase sigma factor (sigma-70 family)